MKKIICGIVLIFVVMCMLAGCQSEKQKSVNQKDSEFSNKNIPGTIKNPNISILCYGNTVTPETYEEPIKVFEEKYGGRVTLTAVTNNEFDTKLVASFVSGDTFDIFNFGQNRMPEMALKGIAQPIDNYFDFNDPVLASGIFKTDLVKYKGMRYCVSTGGEPNLLYYNKSLFDNNGIKTPLEYYNEGNWDWNTFKDVAIALTQDTNSDGQTDQWGYSCGNGLDIFLFSNGADFVKWVDDGNFELTLKDPKVIESLQFYQDAIYKYKYMNKLNWDVNFVAGKYAMVHGQIWYGLTTLKNNMKYEWDFAPFPQSPSGGKGLSPGVSSFLSITTGAKNPEGAAAMIYLYLKVNQEKNDGVLSSVLSSEQINRYKKAAQKFIFNRSAGLGLQDSTKKIYKELDEGIPVMNAIEKYTPIFQEGIDSTLSNAKNDLTAN